MKLPNGDRAEVSLQKLVGYCLNPEHSHGKLQENTTDFGQQFKVDWTVPDTAGIELRTIWEITSTNSNPRLISDFLNHDKKL
ncbi:MAG: hypothetical protein EAZ60_06820 [Oscillatoriales cyanobacterium]|nr:MAG: hypothetical protein EAZ60_06820 [Oscillatoriales cyanobacterium]